MTPPDDPLVALARRLRRLREAGLAGKSLTQRELSRVLSQWEAASVPLISSWENPRKPLVPPVSRLEAYATFFATERSVENQPYQLLPLTDLNAAERARREEILAELLDLREAALTGHTFVPMNLWHFPEGQDITIVCADLPDSLRRNLPYADPESPDYVNLSRFTDLDALFELYGYIRAVNPNTHVHICTQAEALPEVFTGHLVALGRIDWNSVAGDLLQLVDLPVRQEARAPQDQIEGFEVVEGSERRLFKPTIRKIGDDRVKLLEDVAHFYRSPNPLNHKRTVTICNGMFGRGTFGAVRALTDPRFRDRNNDYVRERFGQTHTFSILARVLIVIGEVVTPDWTLDSIRLHEWSPGQDDARETTYR